MKKFLMPAVIGVVFNAGVALMQAYTPAAFAQTAPVPVARQDDLQKLAPGTVFRDCDVCPEMVVVAAGKFQMGSPDAEDSRLDREGPLHAVTFARALAVGKFEITRGEFARFAQATNYAADGCNGWNGTRLDVDAAKNWRAPGFAQSDTDPVVCMNWNDAVAYAQWLTQKSGKSYRLPSEAEWEYAARAGSARARPWGDKAGDACAHANIADHTLKQTVRGGEKWIVHDCADGKVYTAPVGTYQPNAFGLHDMIGNTWEWMSDCWNGTHSGAPADGATRTSGDCSSRAIRGGSWQSYPGFARSAARGRVTPDTRSADYGFRLVRGD
jgi:formylglycine-generating enzyme required for sulfatase activity